MLAVAPTGAGKTRMGLELATSAIDKGGRALWLAPRNELVEQPVRRMRSLGFENIRTIYGGKDEGDPGAPLIVASIQTLVARDMAPPADVVVNDEARHYVVAGPWGELAGRYRDTFRIGLDATPCRGDGQPLRELFDALVPISSVAELTALGFLVPARIIGPSSYDKSLAIDAVGAYLADAPGKRSLCFVASQAEAHLCAERFQKAGVRAMAVDAQSSHDERREALERLRDGDISVLVNCMLYTEGLDLVELEHINIARGIGGPHMWIQIGGRGLRPSPHTGKTECVISDNMGHFHRRNFGPLDDPRTWSLEGTPIETKEGLVGCVQCTECHGWFRAGGACPSCGRQLPKPRAPKLSIRERRELRKKAWAQNKHGIKWTHFVRLVARQREGDRKKNWVFFAFKGKFGHPPPWSVDDVTDQEIAEREALDASKTIQAASLYPRRSTVREEPHGDRLRAADASGSRPPFSTQQSLLFPEDT